MIEISTVILGAVLSLLGIALTVYNTINGNFKDKKKETKECAVDTTTVIVKLENLQNTINRLLETMTSMQTKFENFDHRLTVVETKLALGIADPQSLNI